MTSASSKTFLAAVSESSSAAVNPRFSVFATRRMSSTTDFDARAAPWSSAAATGDRSDLGAVRIPLSYTRIGSSMMLLRLSENRATSSSVLTGVLMTGRALTDIAAILSIAACVDDLMVFVSPGSVARVNCCTNFSDGSAVP